MALYGTMDSQSILKQKLFLALVHSAVNENMAAVHKGHFVQ